MQSFVKLLRGSGGASPPLEELVTLAGRLCRDLQNDPSQMQPLVRAMLDSNVFLDLLDNKDVVMVCARVLAQLEQHRTDCNLLEGCWVSGDTQQLVKLWNDIHYHLVMKRRGLPRLTAMQKFLCRVRNPPPFSLCPDGPKIQHYPREICQKLEDFSSSVSNGPSLDEREILAADTSLTTYQVSKWFNNYQFRPRCSLQRIEQSQDTAEYPRHPTQHGHHGCGHMYHPQWSGGEENRPAQSLVTTQEPWEPLDPACDLSRDKKMPKPQTPREVSSPTGQLVDSHGLDLSVCPADASVAMSLATSSEPSPRGLGSTASDPDPFLPASGSGLTISAGFTDPPNCAPQSTYVEEGLGASISQEGQAGSFLVTQSQPPAPESHLPERNPPPTFLLPNRVKIRLFSREVHRKLYDFASRVTSHPSRAEREILAVQTSLTTEQVRKWFNNYRFRKRPLLCCKRHGVQHIQQSQDMDEYPQDPAQHDHQGSGHVHQPQWSGGEENWPAQSLVTTQGPSEPLDPACDLSRDKKRTKPQKPREVPSPTGQLVDSHGLDLTVCPAYASVAMSLATSSEPSPRGPDPFWPASDSVLSNSEGFTDPRNCAPQSTYLEECLGASISQEGQAGSFLVTESPPPAPESRLPERNPPPASLCPDVPNNRYYPREVRQKLEDFALNVSNKPSNTEREILAAQTSLTIKQVSKWFSNYRLRKRRSLCCQRPGVQLIEQDQDITEYPQDSAQQDHQGSGHVHQPQWSGGEENRPAQCPVTTHGPSEPLDPACDFCGDNNMPQPETPSLTQLAPAGPGPVVELSEPPPSSQVVLSEDETWAFFVTPGSAHAFGGNQPAKNEPGCGGPKDGREVVQESGLQGYLLGGQSAS